MEARILLSHYTLLLYENIRQKSETHRLQKDALVDPLLDDDHNQLRSVICSKVSETFRQLWNFELFDHPQLTIANSITEHKDVPWQLVINLPQTKV